MRVFRIILLWIFIAWCFVGAVVVCCAQTKPLIHVRHDSFTSYYDIERHNPALVCYTLEYNHFAGSYKMPGRHFKADVLLPRPRVMDKDYAGSGYVRGHLCAAADRDSNKKWLKETYLTSNLVPMTMVCNSGPWRVVEDSCRMLAIFGHRLIICRCPLYYNLERPTELVLRTAVTIDVPAGFLNIGQCRDCALRFSMVVRNAWVKDESTSLHNESAGFKFAFDERVSVLLNNILGLWSQEEYETITH